MENECNEGTITFESEVKTRKTSWKVALNFNFLKRICDCVCTAVLPSTLKDRRRMDVHEKREELVDLLVPAVFSISSHRSCHSISSVFFFGFFLILLNKDI